jgi:hypothetical protein
VPIRTYRTNAPQIGSFEEVAATAAWRHFKPSMLESFVNVDYSMEVGSHDEVCSQLQRQGARIGSIFTKVAVVPMAPPCVIQGCR